MDSRLIKFLNAGLHYSPTKTYRVAKNSRQRQTFGQPLPRHSLSRPSPAPPSRPLSPETDRPRTQGLLASTTWLKGTLVTETEVANSLGGTGWLQGKIPGDTRDVSNRMVRLGLTGTSVTVRYGMTYRTSGQAFFNGADQALREVRGEWKSDWTTIRSAVGQLWDNVAGDSTRSRMEQAYGRVGLA